MTPQDLLNTDVRMLGQYARQGFAWWIDELAAMAPPSLRRRAGRGAGWIAELGEPGDPRVRLWREGRAVEADLPTRGLRRAVVAVPRSQVLIRSLSLPLLRASDLRSLVALDLDRLTPFSAEDVAWDVQVESQDPDSGRQQVLLAVLSRDRAAEALGQAEAAGIDPVGLGLSDGAGGVRFDFRQALSADPSGAVQRARLAWITVGVLLALNLAALVGRDMADVAALRQTVQTQQSTTLLARRLHDRVARETEQRRVLLERRARNEPLRVIDAAAVALPRPAFLRRLEWNGGAIRLVGFAPPGFDVAAAVRGSPAFTDPRLLSGGVEPGAPPPGALRPFDLTAAPERAQR